MYRHLALSLCLLFTACASFDDDEEFEREARPGQHPQGELQRAQARGAMPANALMAAAAQREASLAVQQMVGAIPVTWTSIGPGNIGGRVRGICIDPTNSQRIFIATAGGGVWRTDNAGAAWAPMYNMFSMLGCGSLVMDPANPSHLFVGTGEGYFDAAAGSSNTAILRGAGIFETTDAAVTWHQLPSTATPDFYFNNRLAISPANSLVMLAATATGIWRTADGGVSWTQATTARTFDVDFHPTDGTQAVAGRADGIAQYSTDGGVSWTNAIGITNAGRIEIAYSRSGPATVYVAASDVPPAPPAFTEYIKVWRSIDGGHSFAQRTTTNTITTYSYYNNSLWVDPTNSNNIIVAGVQPYRSTDGGVTFAQFSTGAHPDYHVIVEAPGFNGTTNKRVYAGDDGGVHTRADWQSGSWTALNNGLVITQGYGAAVSPSTGTVLLGAQDNDTNRYTGNANGWNGFLIGGDGGFCAADQTDSNYFYGEYQHFGIARSSNAGVSFNNIAGNTVSDPSFNFCPYFTIDPNNSNRMFACGRALWRTDNVKTGSPPTWVQIKAPRTCLQLAPVPDDHFADNPPCNLSTCAVAVGNSNIVWVGHNDGLVYRTANATAATPTWTEVDQNGLPGRWVNSITIDPNNHQHVIVTAMGYVSDNVWETNDDGATWHSISGTGIGAIPALPVSWVVMHPRTPTWLFAGTDLGLYCSIDGGGTWSAVVGGPELTSIEHLVWKNDRDLLVTTHGRGVWFATLPSAMVANLGSGCATGTPPVLSAGAPALGATMTFAMVSAPPSSLVWFSLSLGGPVPQSFGPCTVQVDVNNSFSLGAGMTTATGTWTFGMSLPSIPALVGGGAVVQTFVFAPGGPMLGAGVLSNALQLTLGY
jgi:hypothetical protein